MRPISIREVPAYIAHKPNPPSSTFLTVATQEYASYLTRYEQRVPPFVRVEPRGFEPLTSAVQRRNDTLLHLSALCKIAANRGIF
jgi:hypothetical protein